MERNFKLSNYLNPFVDAYNKAVEFNMSIDKKIKEIVKEHPEYNQDQIQKALNYTFYKFNEDVKKVTIPHVPTKEELEKQFNNTFKDYEILAKIGTSGKQIHKVTANALDTSDGYILWSASSHCGSQKWNIQYPSPIFPIESADLSLVNCDKCNGIRVAGGKEANKPTLYKCAKCGYTNKRSGFEYGNYVVKRYKCPQCNNQASNCIIKIENPAKPDKKPKIDPLSRPLEFSYTFKKQLSDGRIFDEHERIKASNQQEAIQKITKHELSFDPDYKLSNFELQKVSSWNWQTLWKKGDTQSIPTSTFKSKSQIKRESKPSKVTKHKKDQSENYSIKGIN